MFKYTYSYDHLGYTIMYEGNPIDGLCTLHVFMPAYSEAMWMEYHKAEAQRKLTEILKSKGLWQKKKLKPLPSQKTRE